MTLYIICVHIVYTVSSCQFLNNSYEYFRMGVLLSTSVALLSSCCPCWQSEIKWVTYFAEYMYDARVSGISLLFSLGFETNLAMSCAELLWPVALMLSSFHLCLIIMRLHRKLQFSLFASWLFPALGIYWIWRKLERS